MKKFLIAACAVLLAGQTWGEVPGDDKKVSDIDPTQRMMGVIPAPGDDKKVSDIDRNSRPIGADYKNNVYFFDGFDFDNYQRNDPNLTTLNLGEIRAIRNGVSGRVTAHGSKPYSIIGHSQGGLRALGYTSILKSEPNGIAETGLIDAVVTVSGIDQGLKMLDGGLGGFKARVNGKVNIVWNGLIACTTATFNFDPNWYLIPLVLRNNGSVAADVVLWAFSKDMRNYWAEALRSTDASKVRQIGDMIPGSGYIRDNVVKNEEYRYRTKTGTKLTAEWRSKKIWPGITIWYVWIGYVDVYAYVSVTKSLPQFNPDVPVGFIVGTNNNTLSMGDNEQGVRVGLKAFEIGFAVAEGVHIAKCAALIGFLTGSPLYAADADRARRFAGNIDAELNDIKGESRGDGLVAYSHQQLPQYFTEPDTGRRLKVLPNPYLGYTEVKETHNEILKNSYTWEEAGKMLVDGRKRRGR